MYVNTLINDDLMDIIIFKTLTFAMLLRIIKGSVVGYCFKGGVPQLSS